MQDAVGSRTEQDQPVTDRDSRDPVTAEPEDVTSGLAQQQGSQPQQQQEQQVLQAASLPRHESVGSFQTAPEQAIAYRNSVASLGTLSQRNTAPNGSPNMAKIAEVSEDSATSTTTTPKSAPLALSRPEPKLSGMSGAHPGAQLASNGETTPREVLVPSTRVQTPSASSSRRASLRASGSGSTSNAQEQPDSTGEQSSWIASIKSSPQLLAESRSMRSVDRSTRSSPNPQKNRNSGAESSAGSSSQHNSVRTQERKRSSKEAIPPLPRSSSFYAQSQSGSAQNLAMTAVLQDGNGSIGLPPGAATAVSRHPTPLYSPPVSNPQPQQNRISAPLLSSPPAGIPYGMYDPESVYTASPSPIFDSGFGASSPYPPIGASSQRYSLPVVMGASASRSPNSLAAQLPHVRNTSATSLRPQPTATSSRHLPEMHPSALEARPSQSAPFPPSSSPPRGYRKDGTAALGVVAPAAVQQRERPDASRPLGQEICLECLMRDRDMADVEVTGPGIWSRASDADFEEALRAEETAIKQHVEAQYAASSVEDAPGTANVRAASSTDENYYMPGGLHQGRHFGRDGLPRAPSRESSVGDGGGRPYKRHTGPQRIVGGGQPLLATSLKLWTSMVCAAFSHMTRCALTCS